MRILHLHDDRRFSYLASLQWFMTVYSNSFPFDLVTRVWDIFWYEGWKIMYRVALALLKAHEGTTMCNRNAYNVRLVLPEQMSCYPIRSRGYSASSEPCLRM
jgi:hypothetical protein